MHHIQQGQVLRPPGRAAVGEGLAVRRARCRRRSRAACCYDGQTRPSRTAPSGMPGRRPAVHLVPLRPHGPVGERAGLGHDRRQVRPVRRPVLRRRPDATRCVMRVALEKVNGVYQGACFPFRSGLAVRREPARVRARTAACIVGQTNRGWGSLGGKPYGLQRLVYTGVVPFEIHTMKLTKSGFDLTFTKPLDPATARQAGGLSRAVVHLRLPAAPTAARRRTRGPRRSTRRSCRRTARRVSLAVPGLQAGPGVRICGSTA